jgi:hypothetical protein
MHPSRPQQDRIEPPIPTGARTFLSAASPKRRRAPASPQTFLTLECYRYQDFARPRLVAVPNCAHPIESPNLVWLCTNRASYGVYGCTNYYE